MSNRTLVAHDDGKPTVQDDGELGYEGWHSRLRIERSAAGRPGLMFIIEDWENGMQAGESCVVVEDGNELLAPVFAWLANLEERTR